MIPIHLPLPASTVGHSSDNLYISVNGFTWWVISFGSNFIEAYLVIDMLYTIDMTVQLNAFYICATGNAFQSLEEAAQVHPPALSRI